MQKITLALLIVVACTTPDRGATRDTSAARARADTVQLTTHDEIVGLTQDVTDADRDLATAEDSIYSFMGDSVTLLLKQADSTWRRYRKLECDAIRMAYSGGSMEPEAQMECWIDVTDDHRKLLAEEYDYMRNGRPPARRPR